MQLRLPVRARYTEPMHAFMVVLLAALTPASTQAEQRLGDATKPHEQAPPEVAQLAFLVGQWKARTTFKNADGTERHTTFDLEGRYILSGYGIQIVEVHTPDRKAFPEVDSTFVTTTVFNYDTDNDQWSGASVNSLGNRKFVDGRFEDGKLVLIQNGKLFRNRKGQNRLTYFNISADQFELTLDYCDEKTDAWVNGSYSYVATRVEP